MDPYRVAPAETAAAEPPKLKQHMIKLGALVFGLLPFVHLVATGRSDPIDLASATLFIAIVLPGGAKLGSGGAQRSTCIPISTTRAGGIPK
ncbi:MAG: hypothetical protein U0271_19435 [Polyangiaceae bacterium]